MHEPTRFGDFLLLRKLSEDPLGELYRAGRVEQDSLGDLVFLRTYNAPGHSSELVDSLRGAKGRRIEGPGLAYAIESGGVGGVPYSAYAYSTGWSLLRFIETASSGFSDLERDHGLLIVERLAKGLAVVHQADPATARPYHGFLVPQNVRLSSEGEIDLMGFESGPVLARLAAAGRMADVHAYLSVEARSGEALTPSDDVYSLGAILWHLLIGQPPPLEAAGGLTAALAGARMNDGEIVPAGLAELLQSSLAPKRVRTQNANLWYQKLSEWMGRNELTTTHFDLAFFIHELFRKQIQEEQKEIEQEKRLGLKPAAPPAPAEPVPAAPEMSNVILRPDLSGMVQRPEFSGTVQRPDFSSTVPRPELSNTEGPRVADQVPAAQGAPAPSSKAPIMAVGALVLLAAVAGWYFLGREPVPPPPPPVQAAPPPPPPPQPSGELQIAQLELERLIQEQSAGLGDEIAAQYDEEIRSLRDQLKAAQEAEEAALASATSAESAESVEAPAATDAASPEPISTAEPASSEPPGEADTPAPVEPPAPIEPVATEPIASEPPPVKASSEAAPVDPPPPPPPPEVAPPPPPPPEVTPPRRLSLPEPRYPSRALQQSKEATVLIKVLVDIQGRVVDAQPVVDKGDPYGFFREALIAARKAEFKPALSDGTPIQMWTTVVIAFKMRS